jgi:ankyrin repeat protein
MKKGHFAISVLLIFLIGILWAEDYRWDLADALIKNDLRKIESILKENINKMSVSDKRIVMNFAINYSYGNNTLNVFSLLQKYNIRPNGFDLFTAINRNQSDSVIQYILSDGANPNGEILLVVMEKKKFDFAKQFIEMGIDVNYRYPLTKNYADGMTPLLYAAKWNNFELVKLLLEHGANIEVKAKDGNTALSIAQANGNIQIYNYLKEYGAVEIANNNIPPAQTGGISSMFDNQAIDFQKGTYRLFNGSIDIKFSGNTNTGNIDYTRNGRAYKGSYKIEGNNMTILMEGKTFIYKIDSNVSFSGNDEVWIRIGN